MKTFLLVTFIACLYNQSIAQHYSDGCDFEDSCTFLRPLDPGNIWEVGVPTKPVITSASSPVNCLITDTTNPVDTNLNAYAQFDFYVGKENETDIGRSVSNFELTFQYNCDLAMDSDFVRIEIAFDSSEYKNVDYWQYMSFQVTELYESLIYYIEDYIRTPTDTGFTGNSGGWLTGRIYLYFYTPVQNAPQGDVPSVDTVHIRFTILTDSVNTSYDGFALDNLQVLAITYGSIETADHNESWMVFPNPAQSTCLITCHMLVNTMQLIKLYNLHGELVTSLPNQWFDSQGNTILNVEELKPGTYICTGISDDTFYTGTFVKL